MASFDEKAFEKKLLALKDSQESISTLSDWCLQNRTHHKKIVNSWLHVLKRVKVDNRLTLFYLANDVIQYSKRKNYDFVESWGTALQKATTMVRDEKVIHRILRIFNIWGDRNVYDDAFLTDLRGLLTATKGVSSKSSSQKNEPEPEPEPAPAQTAASFEASNLFLKINNCKQLEDDTDLKLKLVNECKLKISELDSFRKSLKDRKHADDMVADVEDVISSMEAYKKALHVEMRERKAVIELLHLAEKFYENERGEAKIVFNAYRNFGSRVKTLKRKLDDLIPSLPSPVPSPDVNAPSPSPDSDIDLPNDEDLSGKSVNIKPDVPLAAPELGSVGSLSSMSTFMGSGLLPFDLQRNLFGEDRTEAPTSEPRPVSSASDYEFEGKPIEVINRRSKEEETADLFTNLVQGSPARTKASAIPGLGDPLPSHPAPSNPRGRGSPVFMDYTTPSTPAMPLPPPPLPPLFDSEYAQGAEQREREDTWNNALPAKFPTWRDTSEPDWERSNALGNGGGAEVEIVVDSGSSGKGSKAGKGNGEKASSGADGKSAANKTQEWLPALPLALPNLPPPPIPLDLDTPESPPIFEKEPFNQPVEYDDRGVGRNPLIGGSDVDHRQFLGRHTPAKDVDHRILTSRFKKDVDHRNLISLTGSPGEIPPPPMPLSLWGTTDQDYRTIPIPPRPQARTQRQAGATDIVESVDMEMSDEDDGEHHHREKVPRLSDDKRTSVSVPSKNPHESSVKGKDKTQHSSDSHRSRFLESPVPPQRFQHPPPMPHLRPEFPLFNQNRFPPVPPVGPPPGLPLVSAPPGIPLRLRHPAPIPLGQPPLIGTPPAMPTSPAPVPPPHLKVNTPPPVPQQQGTPTGAAGAAGALSSGQEESDTDSIGQYLNVGLSDDEDLKDLVASMDPQILAEVVEASTRNGAENAENSLVLNNGDVEEHETDWSVVAGPSDPNSNAAFTPRSGRNWKHRPGSGPGTPTGPPSSPGTPRFRGQSPSSNWRSPQVPDWGGFGRGRGRGFRPFRGGPRGGPRQTFTGW